MRAVKTMAELLTAEEIKEIRELYGLSQRSFAQLLGIGIASIVRYEQGITPSRANANLIRAARHPQFMKECLERDGDLIPATQRNRAKHCIYALIDLEPGEAADIRAETQRAEMEKKAKQANRKPTMDEVYHYTIQQEVLNEQAANLIGEIISLKITEGIRGQASDVFEDLLDALCRIKPTIVSNETMDDQKLASIKGFLECATKLINKQLLKVA